MTKKEISKYKCGFCEYKFEQEIGSSHVGCCKKSAVSSQVKCPRCGNGLKTWQ